MDDYYSARSIYSRMSYADSIDPMYYHPSRASHIPSVSSFATTKILPVKNKQTNKCIQFHLHQGDTVWYENYQYVVEGVCDNGMQLESAWESRYISSENYHKLSKAAPPRLKSLIKSKNNSNAYHKNNHESITNTTQCNNQDAISQHENAFTSFKIGDTLELVGLQNKKHWNGKTAVIVAAFVDDKKRWPVELIDTKSLALIRPQNMKAIYNIFTSYNNIFTSTENDESIKLINQKNSINSKNQQDTSDITTETMNLCRLNKIDLKSVIDDENIDEVVTSLYVRVAWENSWRVCKIIKTIDYLMWYKFMGITTTKGLTISYGTTVLNKKFNQISNDDFTESEIHLWKQRLQKNDIQLPTHNTLNDAADTINTIRNTVQKQLEYFARKQRDAQKDISQNADLNSYISAINLGSNCFWRIPTAVTAHDDSKYVAFLLIKNSKNSKNLVAAQQIATNQRKDIVFAEIREWTVSENSKTGYLKSKGWLIDCKDKTSASNIHKVLMHFIPYTFGKQTPANFCRFVLQQFGDAYMNVHLLPIEQKPTVNKQRKNKPFGPKYKDIQGEPSIATINEYSEEVKYGEYDCGSINDDIFSTTSAETAKYDDFSHMKLSQKIFELHLQRVVYQGEQYDVVHVLDDKIRIENNFASYLVSANEVNKIS